MGAVLLSLFSPLIPLVRSCTTLIVISDSVHRFLTTQIQHLHGELVNDRSVDVEMPQRHWGSFRPAAVTARRFSDDFGNHRFNSTLPRLGADVDYTTSEDSIQTP